MKLFILIVFVGLIYCHEVLEEHEELDLGTDKLKLGNIEIFESKEIKNFKKTNPGIEINDDGMIVCPENNKYHKDRIDISNKLSCPVIYHLFFDISNKTFLCKPVCKEKEDTEKQLENHDDHGMNISILILSSISCGIVIMILLSIFLYLPQKKLIYKLLQKIEHSTNTQHNSHSIYNDNSFIDNMRQHRRFLSSSASDDDLDDNSDDDTLFNSLFRRRRIAAERINNQMINSSRYIHPNDIYEYIINTRSESCIICTENISIGDNVIKLSCGHYSFHSQCLMTWFETKPKRTCPVCRTEV